MEDKPNHIRIDQMSDGLSVERNGHLEPREPLLSIKELDRSPQELDARLRPTLKSESLNDLRTEEMVVRVEPVINILPNELMDPREALRRATDSSSVDEIGENGPASASIDIHSDDNNSRYKDPHGRDLTEVADDTKDIYPQLALNSLLFMASTQGIDQESYVPEQPFGFERPGSIILVKRQNADDPIATKFKKYLGWNDPFYASADAPGRFVNLAYCLYQSDNSLFVKHSYPSRAGHEALLGEAFDLSARLLLQQSSENPQGLIEYSNPVVGGGMRNQGWRDSSGAMVHADGSWADQRNGIASTEVQAVSMDALFNAHNVFQGSQEFYHNDNLAGDASNAAWKIRQFLLEDCWVDIPGGGGYFALGHDRDEVGDIQRMDVKTPMPDLLRSSLFKSDNLEVQQKLREYIWSLFTPDVLTRNGMRSMSTDSKAFGKNRYHEGLIWKHIDFQMGAAMSENGYYGLDRILSALSFRVIETLNCYPEVLTGVDSEFPTLPDSKIYVWNTLHEELYLAEQESQLGQAWVISGYLASKIRFQGNVAQGLVHATDPVKLAFEKKVWNELLSDEIKNIVLLHDKNLALALSA